MPHPKKHRIILADPLEDRRAVTRFVLETMGYFVLGAASLYEAAELGSEEICAGHLNTLLLAYAPVSEDYLLDVAESLACPSLFIPPDAFMADVLERVKVRSARKRGPKPIQPAPVEACA